jgi:hypothetical protein
VTHRSIDQLHAEDTLQRDSNNKSKQGKRQDKNNSKNKELQLIELNVAVKYKERKKVIRDCNDYIVTHDMNIQ